MGWSEHHPVGLIHNSPSLAYRGYTLFTTNGGNHANLVDMEGQICHRWEYHEGISYSQLLLNGNLLIFASNAGFRYVLPKTRWPSLSFLVMPAATAISV